MEKLYREWDGYKLHNFPSHSSFKYKNNKKNILTRKLSLERNYNFTLPFKNIFGYIPINNV